MFIKLSSIETNKINEKNQKKNVSKWKLHQIIGIIGDR